MCCLAAGCAYAPLRAERPAVPLPAEVAAYYASAHPPRDVTVASGAARPGWREFTVQFPLAAEGFEPTEPTVEFEWFESTHPGRQPALVFSPILGGDYPLERGVARFFANHGLHVALVHRRTLKISPEHPVERVELLLRQSVLRVRQVVDWLVAQERVDPDRLGSFGISMGGIAGILTAAVEPRVRVHVVALAGGGIPDILVTSRDSLLSRPRTKYLAANGMDLATFERRLRETIRTDPVLLARYVRPGQLLMVIAMTDRTVGAANALRLWRALGRPEAVFLPTGHYTSYLTLPFLKYQSLRWFRRRFAG